MAKVHINKAAIEPQEPMALKGKQFLDQVSKKSGGHLFIMFGGKKDKWSINRPLGEGLTGCGSKNVDRLQQVFHRWGYHRIITSTLSYTLMAGGAIQQSTVIQLQNAEEELGCQS